MKIIFSPKCVEYKQEWHPEAPQRVLATQGFLRGKYDFIEPKPCRVKDLLLTHELELIENVRSGNFFDFDTPNLVDMFDYARLSAGAAVDAMRFALIGEKAFSLMRPPGHHAGKNFLGGFCYFNNVAVAVKLALKSVKKVAIIDIDGHFGNGTQDIFLDNEKVLFISLHQSPAFPGTGLKSEKNCINYLLAPGTGEKEYLEKLNDAIAHIRKFSPELIAVSAGFDTYKKDPLLNLQLEIESYKKIGNMISSLNVNVFAVLEGGYSDDLPKCIANFLAGLD